MKTKLVIRGNEVYELDEACEAEKQRMLTGNLQADADYDSRQILFKTEKTIFEREKKEK